MLREVVTSEITFIVSSYSVGVNDQSLWMLQLNCHAWMVSPLWRADVTLEWCQPQGLDVTLERCQYYGEFTSNSSGKLMSHSNVVPTTGVLIAHSNGVLTTDEFMSLLNGVSITGDLMAHSNGVPTTDEFMSLLNVPTSGVDVTKVITMCYFIQCLILLSPNRWQQQNLIRVVVNER